MQLQENKWKFKYVVSGSIYQWYVCTFYVVPAYSISLWDEINQIIEPFLRKVGKEEWKGKKGGRQRKTQEH